MEERIIFKTYNSFEADQIIAALDDAGIPSYKREHGIGQLAEIAAGVSRFSLIEIIIPEEAEDAAEGILERMGYFEPAGVPHEQPNENTVQGKKAILDDFAMVYETAVVYLEAEAYLEEFCNCYFIKNRDLKLIPSCKDFYESIKELSGDDCGELIAKKAESLFGLPKRIMMLEDETAFIEELEACSDGWGPFYIVFDLLFCEYENFTLCFISGTNN